MFDLYAKTFKGLEECLVDELKVLGAQEVKQGSRGASFKGNVETIVRANLQLRTALSVIIQLDEFQAINPEQLYQKALRYNWEEWLEVNQTFKIEITAKSSFFTHSQYASLKVKDAIVDRFKKLKSGKRPSVNTDRPDVVFHISILEDIVRIGINTSGDPLFKRGYRNTTVLAPINEVLAAGIIHQTGWNGEKTLWDPMCGSGTFAFEAIMKKHNVYPQYFRDYFGFLRVPLEKVGECFKDVVSDLDQKIDLSPSKSSIIASDISEMSLRKARRNMAPPIFRKNMKLEEMSFFDAKPETDEGVLIMNPPYDERLSLEEASTFYKEIGDHLKQNFAGWDAWIISGYEDAVKSVGLKSNAKVQLYNGKIPSMLMNYKLFKGDLKDFVQKN